MLLTKNRIFLKFSLVFKKYIQEKTLKDFLLLSIDAHKISTVTVSDHVKPYAAVALKLSKKVMRECGHLKFMLGNIIKVCFNLSKYNYNYDINVDRIILSHLCVPTNAVFAVLVNVIVRNIESLYSQTAWQ